jgi:hypothetical protein
VAVFTEEDLADDRAYAYPFGLVGFTLEGCPPVNSVVANVTETFSAATDLSLQDLRKYGPLPPGNAVSKYYTLADENPTANVVLAGQVVSFTLTSAQPGSDVTDPNIIVDQNGPGTATPQVPAPALSPWGLALALLILLGAAGLAIRRTRRLYV